MSEAVTKKYWIIPLLIISGPLSFLILFHSGLRKENYVRFTLAGIVVLYLFSLSSISSVVGLNSLLFLDNLLMINIAISPIILWSLFGGLIGLVYGSFVARMKYNLDYKFLLVPATIFILLLIALYMIDAPNEVGFGSIPPPLVVNEQPVVSNSDNTSASQDGMKSEVDPPKIPDESSSVTLQQPPVESAPQSSSSATVLSNKTYTGKIGNLAVSYRLDWMSDGSINGNYFYHSFPDFVYFLKGLDLNNGTIRLNEYSRGKLTANCVLDAGDGCFNGTRTSFDGRSFNMKMCDGNSEGETADPSTNNRNIDDTPPSNVYTVVEDNPEFPGGDAEIIKFLQRNIQYPQMERDNDIQGQVLLRFIIMEDGSISDVKVVRGVSPGLDKEAERVVWLLPKFIPGRQAGKAVRVYFNLPVNFKLR